LLLSGSDYRNHGPAVSGAKRAGEGEELLAELAQVASAEGGESAVELGEDGHLVALSVELVVGQGLVGEGFGVK
jgi:hypothetical protein